jgi:diacylglycerol O-acyltransferase / wax synthase
MERMSPLDASFLHAEDARARMHIASVAIFEGPPPDYEEILGLIGSKLHLVPRYRQKVRFVPMGLGRPLWVDDPHFALEYHVRHTALPHPGTDQQLRTTVSRLMSQQLDRARPLWEAWVTEGLPDGRWALVSKVHHCMVDGIAGTDLLAVVLDLEPEPQPTGTPPWRPADEPTDVHVLAQTLTERLVSPYEHLRSARAAVVRPRRLAGKVLGTVKGVRSLSRLARPGARSRLNGALGPHLRWGWARGRLSDVKTIRVALGGTVNDVVLAAITRGFRDLLLHWGEHVDDRLVRTMVPVSIRTESERGTYNNKVSAMFAELPVGVEDPVSRLEIITAQMQDLKESHQAVAGEVLTSLSGFAPALLQGVGMRVAMRLPQRAINTVTTNVPGPRMPLYAAGRQMVEAFPFVPIAGHVRVGLSVFSYRDSINFGITADFDAVPDVGPMSRGIETGLAEMLTAAEAG